jgi:hypothetical protein
LEKFAEIYKTPLEQVKINPNISTGNIIELLGADLTVPVTDKAERLMLLEMGLKSNTIPFGYDWNKAVTWKSLKEDISFDIVSKIIRQALSNVEGLIKLDKRRGKLSMQIPSRVQVKEIYTGRFDSIEPANFTVYDLTKPKDLRQLLESSNMQLKQIAAYREKLAQIVLNSYSLSDILKLH